MWHAMVQLDEGNLGYQMLQRAGWAGAGLGAKASGTEDPLAVKVKVPHPHGLLNLRCIPGATSTPPVCVTFMPYN